jgi:hypothetical protein
MAFNGPPPPLGLKKTYAVGKQPAAVAPEVRNPLIIQAQELLNNPNLTASERTQISTLMQENDYANMVYLEMEMNRVMTRLGLQGGRRRRNRRTRRTRRTRRNKKSMRRRR